jgi:hypothetical protein
MLMPMVTVEARHTNMKSDDMVGMCHSFPIPTCAKAVGYEVEVRSVVKGKKEPTGES